MLIIISPSKTQSTTPYHLPPFSQPALLERTRILLERLKELDKEDIKQLMKVSDRLADLTWQRIRGVTIPHTEKTAGAAILTFQGDVFSGIATDVYGEDDFTFAHKHLRILSGFYGVLRPLDLMQPYRLEMAARLQTSHGQTLYDFWGESLAENLNHDLEQMQERVLVNCASREYSRAVLPSRIAGRIVTITFRQRRNGSIKTIAIYAKRARGVFVDYIIQNRITEVKQLLSFDRSGYRFAAELSGDSELVYVTDLP